MWSQVPERSYHQERIVEALRRVTIRWSCIVFGLAGLYFLWILESPVAVTGLRQYGLFIPFRGTSSGVLWWLGFFNEVGIDFQVEPLGVLISLIPTTLLSWFVLAVYRSTINRRPLTYRLWKSRTQRWCEQGRCGRCGYDL